ncbi:unannotated protein [freshwater metagenome]|uniref:Unannotated protein n=1 Tax=freshwater metagenome TaxID=449393 RepID=A0A6J6P9C8_9ZZZZ
MLNPLGHGLGVEAHLGRDPAPNAGRIEQLLLRCHGIGELVEWDGGVAFWIAAEADVGQVCIRVEQRFDQRASI